MVPNARHTMPLYTLTVFVSAFLLFQIQPLIAKYILPWFGGGPAVWTTSMLFFQAVLLAGYGYAHLSIRFLRPRAQAFLHLALLFAALSQLPVTPSDALKPIDGTMPTARIMVLLFLSIGLPYLALSATAPLVLSWFARSRVGQSPYRLYALSNLGSLLALVSYPFVVEPLLSRSAQATIWSAAFGLFVVLCGLSAFLAMKAQGVGKASGVEDALDAGRPPTPQVRALWLALSACAAVLFLAVTNQITEDVAVIPFLWVLPLGLYLLTFVIAFDHERWYVRRLFVTILVPTIVAAVWFMFRAQAAPIPQQLVVYAALVFVGCLVCHGELSRLKPHPAHLTGYYLVIALGGALGGTFVAVLAPALFTANLELHLALLGVSGLTLIAMFRDEDSALYHGRLRWAWLALGAAFIALGSVLNMHVRADREGAISQTRNFYGVLTVYLENEGTINESLVLRHGRIRHGMQFTNPGRRRLATSYYTHDSGVAQAFARMPKQHDRRIGMVGMGVGTLAAYGRRGDYFRLYEIDPAIRRLSDSVFTYLSDSAADIDVVMGDARLSLEREASQKFDLLILDAFSGDAIPLHLLTREAFEIYQRHLAPDGVIAILVSTWHLDFEPVVRRLAQHLGMFAATVIVPEGSRELWGSRWMLLSTDRQWLEKIPMATGMDPDSSATGRIWTDDYASLFTLLGGSLLAD